MTRKYDKERSRKYAIKYYYQNRDTILNKARRKRRKELSATSSYYFLDYYYKNHARILEERRIKRLNRTAEQKVAKSN